MTRMHNGVLPLVADCPAEMGLQIVERELCIRLAAICISSSAIERAPSIRTQLSPVSLLPNEILIHIFQHGLNEVLHSSRTLPLPIAVAGVCRSWRAVVLCTPELWTRVFLTSATPLDQLQTYLEKSGNYEIDVSFCRWPLHERGREFNFDGAFGELVVRGLLRHVRRLRSLSLWDVSDAVVCSVMKGLSSVRAPRLTSVSVKANHTTHSHYYQSRDLYPFPFFSGGTPSLTHLDIDHFPIETLRIRSDWRFNVHNLISVTLRTKECPTLGFSLPPYLIEFPALCTLLRSTPNLITLALYGPVIEPDEGFPTRPMGITLPSLSTLIVHRRDPGVRYHCELLSVLTLPTLKHLEVPWHDDLTVELPYANHAAHYLLNEHLQPRFPSVKTLYLHDSAVKWKMPTRTFVKAFPNVEEVVLGGMDVVKFAATLRGFVVRPDPVVRSDSARLVRGSSDSTGAEGAEGALADGAWQTVRRVVLKEPGMAQWKGWTRGFHKWLAARGHAGPVCVEIQNGALRRYELDRWGMMGFDRSLDRLRKHACVVLT